MHVGHKTFFSSVSKNHFQPSPKSGKRQRCTWCFSAPVMLFYLFHLETISPRQTEIFSLRFHFDLSKRERETSEKRRLGLTLLSLVIWCGFSWAGPITLQSPFLSLSHVTVTCWTCFVDTFSDFKDVLWFHMDPASSNDLQLSSAITDFDQQISEGTKI